MRKYFDLNDRAQRALKNNGDTVPFSETGDCNQDSVEQGNEQTISVVHQLVMYIGTFNHWHSSVYSSKMVYSGTS
ncbi:MAG: hypothetical protein HXS46_00605 [Theionarchaea archaeon]|nr:hypothetical protein [Theionarchaea archaeon]